MTRQVDQCASAVPLRLPAPSPARPPPCAPPSSPPLRRHLGLVLVFKQLHRLCHTSQLLGSIQVDLTVEMLPAFYAWLLHCGAPHIHSLLLFVCTLEADHQGQAEESQGQQLLGACLAALSAARGLRQLSLHTCFAASFSTAGWPAGRPGLTCLELMAPSRLLLGSPPGLGQLAQLRELRVVARHMDVWDDLPPSLARLDWEEDEEDAPPPEVSWGVSPALVVGLTDQAVPDGRFAGPAPVQLTKLTALRSLRCCCACRRPCCPRCACRPCAPRRQVGCLVDATLPRTLHSFPLQLPCVFLYPFPPARVSRHLCFNPRQPAGRHDAPPQLGSDPHAGDHCGADKAGSSAPALPT